MTAYFVTGATGFIGRHLVERLLEREGDIHVLVREGSREKLDALMRRAQDRIKPVIGDLERAAARRRATSSSGQIDHFFHLAAIYDMGADEDAQRAAQRRRHAERDRPRQRARGRHASTTCPRSRSPASTTRARSTRTCSTRARSWPTRTTARSSSPRSSSASASRRRGASTARRSSSATAAPARWTRSTGPTTSSSSSRRSGTTLPEWFPLISLEWGWTNIVPVDYVAAAVDHIAHEPDLDGQTFHVVDPKGQRVGEVLNTFAEAGHAPKAVMRIDRRATAEPAQGRRVSFAMKLPALKQIRAQLLADLGHPGRGRRLHRAHAAASTPATPSARCAAPTSTIPPLRSYADEALGLLGAHSSTPTSTRTARFEGAVNGKTVVITGASSGIGRAAALKIAAAGGIPILVARTKEKLDEVKAEIEAAGGTAYVAPCDLSDFDAIEKLVETLLAEHAAHRHAGQQRGPQHPPQRRALLRPLPRLRAHGPPQLPLARAS